ncbi:MAG TPA: aminotransferase class I/II-fold pyridoxal phosphate-dependent enzyme [Solirubrobacterales bacterium]|nr:aminotransferase class I/II-fold pyridoxal phosphate-dependent enzyme [Solirubrobacterales bacterium]
MRARAERRGFASDNHAGAHPEVLAALADASGGHVTAYGDDPFTAEAADLLRDHFGADAEPFFVFNGTAANVLALDAVTRPHEAVICAETAHMHVDECGAPERIAGVKLLTVPTEHGKLGPGQVGGWDTRRGDEHQSQPRVVSISQATELGTVYTIGEIRAIAEAAHERDMLLHVDGARLANAAASLDTGLAALTTDLGVDVVSFGGTKNGLVLGEAVVFTRPGLADHFRFVRKQGMQLGSKMRFIAAQFAALMRDDLWLRSARHANEMASVLAERVAGLDGVEIVHPVEASAVFARLEPAAIEKLLAAWPSHHPFYVWDEEESVVRWMCAWDTQPEDVEAFASAVETTLESLR